MIDADTLAWATYSLVKARSPTRTSVTEKDAQLALDLMKKRASPRKLAEATRLANYLLREYPSAGERDAIIGENRRGRPRET